MYELLSGSPPFYSKDKSIMFRNILEKPIEMKSYFSVQAVSILHGLLCLDVNLKFYSKQFYLFYFI